MNKKGVITIIGIILIIIFEIVIYQSSFSALRSNRKMILLMDACCIVTSFIIFEQYTKVWIYSFFFSSLVFVLCIVQLYFIGESHHKVFFRDYYVSLGVVYKKSSRPLTRAEHENKEYIINFRSGFWTGIHSSLSSDVLTIDTLLVQCPATDQMDVCRVFDLRPDKLDLCYYQHPVLFVNNKEFGNDYYYYAKLRPDLALKNFGLNKLTIGKDNLLCYKNVNDSIDSQVHQCADSLQSQLNRDMLDTADAFYFHGEIIPAEQVFAEIPQTRAYYERYCGKLE